MMTTKALCLLPALLVLAIAPVAYAKDKPTRDPIADCEAFALKLAKAQGADLKAVTMERGDSLETNRFEQKVGNVMVPVEYIGWAQVIWADGKPQRQRFVCLHTGDGGHAIYTVFIPNEP